MNKKTTKPIAEAQSFTQMYIGTMKINLKVTYTNTTQDGLQNFPLEYT